MSRITSAKLADLAETMSTVDDWNRRVRETIEVFAHIGVEFNGDDVRAVCGARPHDGKPHAIGGYFKSALQHGKIRKVGTARSTYRQQVTLYSGMGVH